MQVYFESGCKTQIKQQQNAARIYNLAKLTKQDLGRMEKSFNTTIGPSMIMIIIIVRSQNIYYT
jgi:hypothetical protein